MNEPELKRLYRTSLNTAYGRGFRPLIKDNETLTKIKEALAPLQLNNPTTLENFTEERAKGSLLSTDRAENNARLLCEITARVLENYHNIPTTIPIWMWLLENTCITNDWRGFLPFPIKGGIEGINPLSQEKVFVQTNNTEELGEFTPRCTIRDLRHRYNTTPPGIKKILNACGLSDLRGNPYERKPDLSYTTFYGTQNVFLWNAEETIQKIDEYLQAQNPR